MNSPSAQTVLVVDDEEMIRELIKRMLMSLNFQVLEACNGEEALSLIQAEPSKFNLVISDMRMPKMDGITLLKEVKSRYPIPFIIVTGFALIMETQEAYELGVDGFINKPFSKDELLESVQKALPTPLAPPQITPRRSLSSDPKEDQDFCKIDIHDFIAGREIPYSIYIRLSEHKYIKLSHGGEDLARDRIEALKAKGIQFLYLQKQDFRSYLGLNLRIAKQIRHLNLDDRKKVDFLCHTTETLLQDIYRYEFDREKFEEAKMVITTTVDLLAEDNDILQLLSSLNEHNDVLYAHSLAVSLYGSMVAKELNWKSPITIFKVSMGGLFHDIGKKELSRELVLKPRFECSDEEIRMIETHPVRGAEIIRSLERIPEDIAIIAQQHHENCTGLGYPRRLTRQFIYPLARLIGLCNVFCSYVVVGPGHKAMTPHAALNKILQSYPGHFERDHFAALSRLCKFTTPDPIL